MNKLKDLQKKFRELKDRAKELRAIKSEDYTQEQRTELAGLVDQMEQVAADIEVEERTQKIFDADDGENDLGAGDIDGFSSRNDAPMSPHRPAITLNEKRFRNIFSVEPETGLDNGGFRTVGDFLNAVNSGRADSRLDALNQRTMIEGVGSDGGFAVPDEFSSKWLDDSLENEIVRPRCTVWPMASKTRTVPGFKNTDNTSSLYGGIICYWEGEAQELTESNAELRKIVFEARKLTCLTSASNEVLADGGDLESQLGTRIEKSIGWSLDSACFTGTGAGQPLGMLNSPSVISVAKETGQPALTIVYENLVKMLARLHPGCFQNSVWIANTTTIPQLTQLEVGAGDTHIPVMKENNGAFSILTRPVLFTEKIPALGNVGDIMLADLSQYALGIRKEITLDKSGHVGFTKDTTFFRCILRVDGAPTWDSPVTPKNGDTLSWCVTLAERA